MDSFAWQTSDKGEDVGDSNTNKDFGNSNCLNLMPFLFDKSFGLDMTQEELVQTIRTVTKDNIELQGIIRESNITMNNLEQVLLDMKKKQEVEHAEVKEKSEQAKFVILKLRHEVQSLKNELEQVKMESTNQLNSGLSGDQLHKITKELDQREHQISQLVQQNKKLAEERKLIRDEKEQLKNEKIYLEMRLADMRQQLGIECDTTAKGSKGESTVPENQSTEFGTSPVRLETENVSVACDNNQQIDAEKKQVSCGKSAAGHITENVETLKAQVVSLINELNESEKKQSKILSMADHYRQRCEDFEKENAALKTELDSLRCKDDQTIDALRSTIADYERLLSEQKAKNEEQSLIVEEYRIRTAELQEECSSLKIQLNKAQLQSHNLATSGAILMTLEEKRNQDDKLGCLTAQLLTAEDKLFQKQEEIQVLQKKLEKLEKQDASYLKTQVDYYRKQLENEQVARRHEIWKINELQEQLEALQLFNQDLQSQLAQTSSLTLTLASKHSVTSPSGGNDECDKYATDQKRSNYKDQDKPERTPSENVEECLEEESTRVLECTDYICPKCGLKTQDYDSLAIHADDCTNESNE